MPGKNILCPYSGSITFTPKTVSKTYRATVVLMQPPVILNLREDRAGDPHVRNLLTEKEVNYFKRNGNNATVFIHGFNVEYGEYSRKYRVTNWQKSCLTNKDTPPHLEPVSSSATVFRNKKTLEDKYTNYIGRYPNFLSKVNFDNINGTGAHNWYIHIERLLNKIAGGVTHAGIIKDFKKYTRTINVAWSGDVLALNYISAERRATEAGIKLTGVIKQLLDEGISTNIIAHSLGNRVLLTVMNILGQDKKFQDRLEHVFMWQPAVPDTALSNNPKSDTSVLRNWNFIHAHKGAKKIIVLHSEHDNVLGPHPDGGLWEDLTKGEDGKREVAEAIPSYPIASQLGVPLWDEGAGGFFTQAWKGYAGHVRNELRESRENIEAFLEEVKKDNLFETGGVNTEELSPKAYEFFLPILYCKRLSREAAEAYCKAVKAVAKATANTEFKDIEPRPAMGHGGPEIKKDTFVAGLTTSGKLVIVDQTNWLHTHSGIKEPCEDLYREVYQKWIWKETLSKTGFGRY